MTCRSPKPNAPATASLPPALPPGPQVSRPRASRPWLLLLALPYLGLCSPAIYARATPSLFGFPFFYWYQFLWVVLTAALLGIVYFKLRRREETATGRMI